MSPSPEELDPTVNLLVGLARYLDEKGIVVWKIGAGGTIFLEDLPQAEDSPAVMVGIYSTGGPEADSLLGYDAPNVQLIVRGTLDARSALSKWDAIYNELHGLRNIILPDGTYLVYCLAVQSAPVRMGPDQNGRHRFSLNLRTEIRNVTTFRE